MKNCWACSKELDDDAKYCSKCGSIVDKSVCYPKETPRRKPKPKLVQSDSYKPDKSDRGWNETNSRWGTSEADYWERYSK